MSKNGVIVFDDKETGLILNDFINKIIGSDLDFSNAGIIGIKNGGIVLADLIKKAVLDRFGIDCKIGYIDMTLYRDDPFAVKKSGDSTDINFDINDKEILLVDDVISSGRTVRASIDEIFDFGRPAKIKLAVFIDKEGRELPICPDFIGRKIKAEKNEIINVNITSTSDKKFVEKI